MNVKVFSLVTEVNETKFLVQKECKCECKCRLNESAHNSKQKWNHDKCKCKQLDNCDSCKKDHMWNPITCDCECNKTCKIDKYLDIENYSCEKRLFDKFEIACKMI